MSVDLPEPEDPMMATNSPAHTVRFTPRSARTFTSPKANVRVTRSILMTGWMSSEPSRGMGRRLTVAVAAHPAGCPLGRGFRR